MGKDIFREGLRIYLRRHAYSNATKHDLWDAIQEAAERSGKRIDVARVIEEWVTKKGHPLVHVRRAPGGFSLRQERFMLLGKAKDSWPIPVRYMGAGGVSETLMERSEKRLGLKGSWIKLNSGQRGFYRVMYEDGLLDGIGRRVQDGELGDIDTWGIENDMFAFARSARICSDEYLDFMARYCMDKGYPANASISSHLNWLCFMGHGHDFAKRAKEESVRFHRKALDRVGWERRGDDSIIDVIIRSAAISSLGFAGDKPTLARAKKEFDTFVDHGEAIDVDIRGAVYALNAWQDGGTFGFFLKRYKEEKAPDEQRRNLRALGSFSDPAMLEKSLRLSNSKDVRLQDSFVLPAAVSENPVGKGLIWGWTRRNWQDFLKRYDPGTHMLGGLAENLSVVSDRKTASEIEAFFSKKGNRRGDMDMALRHSLERIQANIKFIEKNEGRH